MLISSRSRLSNNSSSFPIAPEGAHVATVESVPDLGMQETSYGKTVRQILGFDPGDFYELDDLVGKRATLVLGHDEANGKTYANVRAILTLRAEAQ